MVKNKRTTAVVSRSSERLHIAVDDVVTDHRGNRYQYIPDAKPPHSKHLAIYPESANLGDEEIPIQNRDTAEINGLSAELMLVAVYQELSKRKDIDPAVLRHLSASIKILELNQTLQISPA